jgi:hypothetical protein
MSNPCPPFTSIGLRTQELRKTGEVFTSAAISEKWFINNHNVTEEERKAVRERETNTQPSPLLQATPLPPPSAQYWRKSRKTLQCRMSSAQAPRGPIPRPRDTDPHPSPLQLQTQVTHDKLCLRNRFFYWWAWNQLLLKNPNFKHSSLIISKTIANV